jgi:Na+-transporting methylmalonyl-CoA/oxaloacetate decarboxylase gamma subunit
MIDNELLWNGVKVFVFGFGGVFVNMAILFAILKLIGAIIPAVEKRRNNGEN